MTQASFLVVYRNLFLQGCYSTEIFTGVLYFLFYYLFYHSEFLLRWRVAQRPFQENGKEELKLYTFLFTIVHATRTSTISVSLAITQPTITYMLHLTGRGIPHPTLWLWVILTQTISHGSQRRVHRLFDESTHTLEEQRRANTAKTGEYTELRGEFTAILQEFSNDNKHTEVHSTPEIVRSCCCLAKRK